MASNNCRRNSHKYQLDNTRDVTETGILHSSENPVTTIPDKFGDG